MLMTYDYYGHRWWWGKNPNRNRTEWMNEWMNELDDSKKWITLQIYYGDIHTHREKIDGSSQKQRDDGKRESARERKTERQKKRKNKYHKTHNTLTGFSPSIFLSRVDSLMTKLRLCVCVLNGVNIFCAWLRLHFLLLSSYLIILFRPPNRRLCWCIRRGCIV